MTTSIWLPCARLGRLSLSIGFKFPASLSCPAECFSCFASLQFDLLCFGLLLHLLCLCARELKLNRICRKLAINFNSEQIPQMLIEVNQTQTALRSLIQVQPQLHLTMPTMCSMLGVHAAHCGKLFVFLLLLLLGQCTLPKSPFNLQGKTIAMLRKTRPKKYSKKCKMKENRRRGRKKQLTQR